MSEDLARAGLNISAPEYLLIRIGAVALGALVGLFRFGFNLGPLILVEHGVVLIDRVGKLLLSKVAEGDAVRIEGDRVYVGDDLVGVGIRQTPESQEQAHAKVRRAHLPRRSRVA